MKLSDTEILRKLKTGGSHTHRVMDCIYLKSRKKIITYVLKNGGNKQDGQDVLQEAVAAFYTNVINNRFRGDSDIDGYIYGIARNTWLKVLKARGKEKSFKDIDPGVVYESSSSLDENAVQQLDGVLEQMKYNCREILVYAYYYNYSASELSEKFNFKNEQVARNKKSKCLKRLRELMAKIKNKS
ncbi:MAG: sigma-70 family RNA polymerase sigma factor [Bacteroidota bacterium]